MNWTATKIICLVLIIGCLILKGLGIDDVINNILMLAAAFYFGLNLPKPKEREYPFL